MRLNLAPSLSLCSAHILWLVEMNIKLHTNLSGRCHEMNERETIMIMMRWWKSSIHVEEALTNFSVVINNERFFDSDFILSLSHVFHAYRCSWTWPGSHHRARKWTTAATTYYIKRLSAKTTHCLVSLARRSHNQLMGNTCFEGLLRFVRNSLFLPKNNSLLMRLIDWIRMNKTGWNKIFMHFSNYIGFLLDFCKLFKPHMMHIGKQFFNEKLTSECV